jgi:hypothetical protein
MSELYYKDLRRTTTCHNRYLASSQTLEVIVGRGVGEYRRKPEDKGVCQTVQGAFASLHHILCAVESSLAQRRSERGEKGGRSIERE